MKIALEDDSKITPSILVREGKTWLEFYDYAVKDRGAIMPGIYSLFSALEMHLKAYIVLKDSSYSDGNKLKALGHYFERMYNSLEDGEFKNQVKVEMDRYHLFSLNINKLKYPELRRFWHVNQGLEKGQHSLGPIFTAIQKEVDDGMDGWMAVVYPRKIRTGLLLQGEWKEEDYPTDEQIEEWLLLCPNCRPENVLLHRELSWPYCLEEKLPRKLCKKCGVVYSLEDSIMMT